MNGFKNEISNDFNRTCNQRADRKKWCSETWILHGWNSDEPVWKDFGWGSTTGENGRNQSNDFYLGINRTVIGQSNDGKCWASTAINYGRGHRAAKYQRCSDWTGSSCLRGWVLSLCFVPSNGRSFQPKRLAPRRSFLLAKRRPALFSDSSTLRYSFLFFFPIFVAPFLFFSFFLLLIHSLNQF